jgi:hypothetical protein
VIPERTPAPKERDPLVEGGAARAAAASRPAAPSHPALLEDDELMAACVMTRGRSSGPGGQHRNKVQTMVTLLHTPTGVEAHADERRSPEENRRMAIFRLRLALATQIRLAPVARDVWGDVRSDLWRSRVSKDGKIACSPTHRDYPSMLAEAMDVVEASGHDVKKAALRLACSMSQLVKFIKDHPPALERLNAVRRERGQHTLK